MQFNIYQLCENNQTKGSLKVIVSKELRTKINEAINQLKIKKVKMKDLAKNLSVDYTTLSRSLNKNYVSLELLKTLEEQSKIDLRSHIVYLYSPISKMKIKVPNVLDSNLAKIIGCINADGHLGLRKSKRGYHYEIAIREGHKTNIDFLVKWFNEVFEYNPKINKKDNHYYVYISNKIIHKFLTNIIGIKVGYKVDIVSTPEMILNSNKNIKLSYLQGLFMFDGGVEYRTAYVDYISKSKFLVQEILKILRELDLEPDYYSLKPDNYGRFKLRFRKAEKLKLCMSLFEEKSEKWWRLYEHIYGLKGNAKTLKTVLISMNTYYPRVRESSITFSDVINAVDLLQEDANIDTVSAKLNRGKTVVYEYLKKLENWEIISSKRYELRKHYQINKLKIPRREI